VETIWHAPGRIDDQHERIAPTESTVAVIVLADPIRLVAGAGPLRDLEDDRPPLLHGTSDRAGLNGGGPIAASLVCPNRPDATGLAADVR
jgi:hypothetical protein